MPAGALLWRVPNFETKNPASEDWNFLTKFAQGVVKAVRTEAIVNP